MKSIRNSLFSLSLVLLIGQTCAKDSEENLNEDESYVESMYGAKKEVVVVDWKKFVPLAKNMIAISDSNLKSLRAKTDQTAASDEKIKWNLILQKSGYELQKLKLELQQRNLKFQQELKDYDGSSGKLNTDFKTDWLHRIIELNTTLEEAIDE
jgi:hypothetical protein